MMNKKTIKQRENDFLKRVKLNLSKRNKEIKIIRVVNRSVSFMDFVIGYKKLKTRTNYDLCDYVFSKKGGWYELKKGKPKICVIIQNDTIQII